MNRAERRQAASVITLLRRIAKLTLLIMIFIGVLDTFGVDVTTGIAALGIGGLALALGALLFASDMACRSFLAGALVPYAAPLGGFLLMGGWLLFAISGIFGRKAS